MISMSFIQSCPFQGAPNSPEGVLVSLPLGMMETVTING